jgi:hypothetical protein
VGFASALPVVKPSTSAILTETIVNLIFMSKTPHLCELLVRTFR